MADDADLKDAKDKFALAADAVGDSCTASGPRRGYFGDRQFDIREAQLIGLRAALGELGQVGAA